MSFRFAPDETVEAGIERMTKELVDKALDAVDDADPHTVRKQCKKLRAVVRMVRPAVGDDYRAANEAFRDAGRLLAGTRDAEALVEVLDDLVSAVPDAMVVDVSPVSAALVAAHDGATDRLRADPEPLRRAGALIEQGWDVVRAWELDDDFSVLAGGITKTYGRAVEGFRTCLDEATTDALHEWRKRAKYHRYHLEMLENVAPELVEPWADRLHDLSDLLGDDHDLAVLASTIAADPDRYGGGEVVDTVRILIDGRRPDLQARAIGLGARLTAEEPEVVVQRLRLWWHAWRTHGPATELTELADLGEV